MKRRNSIYKKRAFYATATKAATPAMRATTGWFM
jgi:hypothetical protein